MINWQKLVKRIPYKVQITSKLSYEVVWVERFDNPRQVGEMDTDLKQIRIKIDQSNKEKVMTYLHEVIHAFSDENNIGLTERQVTKLENNMLYYWLKPDNLFSRE